MDQAEFSTRLLPMKDKIFRFARSIVSDEAEAEDVMQDVFEKLWTRRGALDGYANLEAFVMSSVRNLCCDRIRRRNMKSGKTESIRMEIETVTAGFSAETRDAAEIALRLMESLPEKQKMVMHLRDVEGYEIDTISEIVEMEPPTVRVMLSRARKYVRTELVRMMEYEAQ